MLADRTPSRSSLVVPLTDLRAMTDDVAGELAAAWQRVTRTSSFIGGELVESFEEEWATYCGTRHAVGVANGTDALELILRALEIGLGDEVIIPANTFVATAEAVVSAGATPRFVDVDRDTLLATPETIGAAVSGRTAAVILVELYGNMPAMEEILRLTEAKHIVLIEDAAQAHGSTWNGRKAGSFGLAAGFSFYPGKNLGAFGDAGAVVTDDAVLAETIRSLANHGRSPGAHHLHSIAGRNSRLDALQAAILSTKLGKLDEWNRARRTAMASYRQQLRADGAAMVKVPGPADSSYHQNVVRVANRDAVRGALLQRGIETGIHYPVPCHRQRAYRSYAGDPLPVADQAADEVLSLPVFPHISENQIAYVSSWLNEILEGGLGGAFV